MANKLSNNSRCAGATHPAYSWGLANKWAFTSANIIIMLNRVLKVDDCLILATLNQLAK